MCFDYLKTRQAAGFFGVGEAHKILGADPTGFEPAIFSVTRRCVRPGYTTGPFDIIAWLCVAVGGLEPPTQRL